MKKNLTTLIIFLLAVVLNAQKTLSLEECYQSARENYPLIKQNEYIEKSSEYKIANIWKGYYPQINLNGQATYQSDVTSLPVTFPGINIETLSKEQYKAMAEISQVIYDGGVMGSQAGIQKASAEAEQNKLEMELIKVIERINQLYFGILLYDEQLIQINLTKNDLQSSLKKLEAAFENGTTLKSNVDVLEAELLKADQKEIEVKTSRKSFIDMLGLLINQNLVDDLNLQHPAIFISEEMETINRPELNLFSSQKKIIEEQNGITVSKILPKASLFFQGGYGKPALNMLKNEFDWYYIAGARLSWQISNLFTYTNEKEIAEINSKSIEAQKETFLLNTNLSLKQYKNEIQKLIDLIGVDYKIIKIRETVKETAKAQLENGVITSNDFLRELNAEDQAKQNLAIHKIQLLLAKQNYKITSGN